MVSEEKKSPVDNQIYTTDKKDITLDELVAELQEEPIDLKLKDETVAKNKKDEPVPPNGKDEKSSSSGSSGSSSSSSSSLSDEKALNEPDRIDEK